MKLKIEHVLVYKEDTDDIMTEEEEKKAGGKYNPPEYFYTIEIGQQKWGDLDDNVREDLPAGVTSTMPPHLQGDVLWKP